METKTINYEQKYKEALEKAKKFYNNEECRVEMTPVDLEVIFPELKESEDDEIRESIAGFLKTISSLKDGQTVSNEDFDTKVILEWVAWLKKQSTSNPYSGVSFKFNGHTWGMCARDNGVEILVDGEIKERVFLDNEINKVTPIFHEGDWIISKSAWTEDDEKKRTLLIKILEVNHPHGLFKINSSETMHTEELVSWLKSLNS